ncbi:MBL fold metallo-hydrolase [Phycisphaerales bacterium AB-hyl4]|uniref:MBL fold metallo-hydrolase n=1 Tax=Natronomicrosphaera hydrolytica TaxID=3242702 RepID=A0ABV4U2L6_9BACT
MSNKLHIETFTLGDWMTNCYVLYTDSGACWLVDVGFGPEAMFSFINRQDLTPQRVVLTHAHVDHIAGLPELRLHWPDLPMFIHEAEREFPGDTVLNLSIALADPVVAPEPTGTFKHGDVLELDDVKFEVRHTPGHSPGGVCLYQREHGVAIVGDTLFAGSVGRHDFPTSDGNALMTSIREQLLTLPDETRVLPGHGPTTTIGEERRTNPFLQ